MRERIGAVAWLLPFVALLSGCSGSSDGGVIGPLILEVGPGGGADYATIHEAVDAAPAGSTILVQPGVYAERVYVSKSLTITGSGPGTVVEYPAGGTADSSVIEVRGASGVRIENLSVRSSPPGVDGVRIRDAWAVVLESIVASDNSADGIDIRRSIGIDVISGTFENNGGDGIQIDENCEDISILSSRSASNVVDGIKVVLSGLVLVQGNVSTLNGDDGILVRNSNDVQFTGNSSTYNAGWGISVNDSTDTLLDGNTVAGNGAGDVRCQPLPCGP